MLKRLPPIIWVIIMYTITGLTEAGPPLHIAEAGHIAIHLAGYFLLAVLMAFAYPDDARRTLLILIGLAFVVGIGQEAIQNIARQRLYLGASTFDLVVDTIGASLGLLGYHRMRNLIRSGKD